MCRLCVRTPSRVGRGSSRPEEAYVTPELRSDLNVAPGRDFGKRRESVADETARDNVLDRLSILSGMEHTGAVHASLAGTHGDSEKMDIGMAVERRSAMATRKWFRRLVLLMVAAIGAGLSWGGWRFWEVQQYQQAIEEIEQQIAAGRNGLAAKNLVSLLAWKPGLVEAIYLLGVCERAQRANQGGL